MKRFLQLIAVFALLFGATTLKAQEYVDSVQLGRNWIENSYPFQTWDEAIAGTSDTTWAAFPFTKQFTFTPNPEDETTTDYVHVDVTVKVDAFAIDRQTGERFMDSVMYIRTFDTGTFGVSPIPYEDDEWVSNGNTRQLNFYEKLDIIFENINNQPPNELYPAVQMKIFGVNAWCPPGGGANVYLNGELVAFFNNDKVHNFTTNFVADLETLEPVAIVVEEGDTLTFGGRDDEKTFLRFRAILAVFEDVDPATGIALSAEGGSATITELDGSVRILAEVTPEDASDTRVKWTLENNNINASINPGGIVTPWVREAGNGTVTVKGTVGDVSSTIQVTISGQQDIPVDSINVTSWNDTISVNGGSLKFNANVWPEIAANKEVIWSVEDNGTGATIDSTGLLRGGANDNGNGVVTVIATATDGSGVTGSMEVTILNQSTVYVETIEITFDGEFAEILEDGGTLQLIATVLPDLATNKTVTWSLEDNTIGATIDETGLLTASSKDDGNGMVKAVATANDGSGISASVDVLIGGQTQVAAFETELQKAISIYPNPTSQNQTLFVEVSNSASINEIEVFNFAGQKLAAIKGRLDDTKQQEISFNKERGLYLIKVNTDHGSVIRRVYIK